MAISQKAQHLPPKSVYPDQVWGSAVTSTTIRQNFTQSEVDAGATAIDSHIRTRVATTANITLSGTQTIDGVTLSDGDRILVKDQTDATENGVWSYLSSGAYTREDDAIQAGMLISVLQGTDNGDTLYACTNDTDPTLDTDNVTFALAAPVDGSGTGGTITKWSDSDTLTDSQMVDNGATVAIGGVIASLARLEVSESGASRSAIVASYTGTTLTQAGVKVAANNGGSGVYAIAASSGNAIWGDAASGIAILGRSDTGEAIYGYSNDGTRTKPIAKLWSDNASSSCDVLELQIDGSGKIIKGTAGGTERFVVNYTGHTTITGNGTGTGLTIISNNTDAAQGVIHLKQSGSYGATYLDTASSGHANHASQMIFRRGRGSITSPSTCNNGDQLGGFYFRAHNGSDYQQRAGFASFLDGSPSGSSVPTNLIFYTGTTGLTQQMQLNSTGDLGIGMSATGTLGKVAIQASNTSAGLYVNQTSTGAIITADDNGTIAFQVLDGGNTYMRSGRRINTRTLTTSPTTLNATDDLVCVNTSAVTHTITLPTPTTGRKITIKDSAGNAAARNITINDSGTELIDGAGTQTISTNYGSLDLVYNGSTWVIV